MSTKGVSGCRAARLDRWQGLSGMALAAFLFCHLHFESSILFGKDAFYAVVRFLEAGFLDPTGHGYPGLTVLVALTLFALLLIHAITAIRRFPQQHKQWQALRNQAVRYPHLDTRLWLVQLITGFALFFLVPVHLLGILFDPTAIGPNQSAYRIVEQGFGWLYLLLLPAVVLHAVIGVYRVCMKWFGDKFNRESTQKVALGVGVWLLIIGATSLVAWLVIGNSLTLPMTPYSPN
ncbi:fumarate reductase cytochrome b subunit [Ferrimonas aestuarii]|uniref:Fumarate reductase cytochrome b subunit n=1 Tax=Ferrimonas aestuarii TaxID=2569539 RepID=A0A4U1BHJ7_9GAMM|nr:fumarate reductase cytochrome b subunit [Ferrimonas aestuarii]TKB50890.1 fumarate reductase cytochrome b subunit [Ferrimonas aestuarii]